MSKLFQYITNINTTEALNTAPTVKSFLLSMIFALALSAVMYFVYRLCHDSLSYNKKFNTTLIMLSLISTVLLNLIQSNVLLSLGVLGSLSICRFRTNTKDPRDIGFVFWSISIGISSATGAFLMGTVSTLLLSAFMLATSAAKSFRDAITLVIRGSKADMDEITDLMSSIKGKTRMMAKNISQESFELVYEIKLKESEEKEILSQLWSVEGIQGINILAPDTKVA
ncbi:DUF4956 domain-containing protein [Clostridium polynesiense]|uniref:DUF4956 domain-containing protein n=1 Tax=Clostridium polynesiense TaxID=1325933 RepID=UPI0006937CE5|nr:DUF4956 domain-containing protein [Clostridium polynesiense]